MLYAFVGEDCENSLAIRKTVRSEHLARIEALQNEGRLLLAGPFPMIDSPDPGEAGFSGSLIVGEFPDLQAATDWINQDPYVTAGVFTRVTVKPFKQVFPK